MWSSILIYLVNYIFGADVWSVQLTKNGLKPGHCLETILYTGALMEVPLIFFHIYKVKKNTKCIQETLRLTSLFSLISVLQGQNRQNEKFFRVH